MGKPLKDEVGNTYNMLTVKERGPNSGTTATWLCQCSCGSHALVLKTGHQLRSGKAISCGCSRNPYLAVEDEYLLSHYKTTSKAVMAKHLGRTVKSVEKHLLVVLKVTKSVQEMGSTRRYEVATRNSELRENYRGSVPDEWFDLPASFLAAEQQGAERLFTGQPCKRQHIAPRRFDNMACIYCIQEDGSQLRETRDFKLWRKAYRQRITVRESERELRRERMKDPAFKYRVYMSSRISAAMRANKINKPAETEKLLGIGWSKFREWIDSQLQEGMTMENYGKWHLDHVRPCASFNLVEAGQCFVAFNWRNYQPLWGDENLRKNDFYDKIAETKWVERMYKLGYEEELFLKYN